MELQNECRHSPPKAPTIPLRRPVRGEGARDGGERLYHAGYSGTPLPRKLGIKPGHRVALLRAPEGFDATLGELPDGVAVRGSARGPLDVIVSFTGSERELRRRFATLARALDVSQKCQTLRGLNESQQ